ncbi:MAG: hypothetical protein JJE35_13705 [Thermoleophilia bacterium]|nr:hypothetical protein [Thermoleophilia bacterium]
MKQIRKRLTYANVMSSLAVFLILGGATAFAATKIGSNEIKADAILTGKIKKEAVTTAKIRKNAVTGAKANEASFGQVPSAAFALNAETASPRAYAKVLASTAGGGIDESKAKGITDQSVAFVGGSVYCFELGFTPKSVQATVEWIGGGTNTFAQASVGKYESCPAGSDATVRTTDNAGAGLGSISFYVSFDG